MQSSWISCAKSDYARTNSPLRKEKRPPGVPQGHFLRRHFAPPSQHHIFRITTKDMEERRAKGPFVLWNLR